MDKAKFVKFLELFSVAGFLIAFVKFDLQFATMILMILMTVFILAAKLLKVELNKLQFLTWVIVIVLGAATLAFKDVRFIKWKTTVINAILATAFALSHLIGEKTFMERILGTYAKIQAPVKMLRNINLAAIIQFILIASLNLYFAYYHTENIWMTFKLGGVLVINIIFIAWGFYYLRDYLKDFLKSLEKK